MDIIYPGEPLGIYSLAEGMISGKTIVWFVDNQAKIFKFKIRFPKMYNDIFSLPCPYRDLEIIYSSIDEISNDILVDTVTTKLNMFYTIYQSCGHLFFVKKYAIRNMKEKINKLKKADDILLGDEELYVDQYPEYFI